MADGTGPDRRTKGNVMTPYDNPDYWAFIRGIRSIDLAGGDSTLARLVTADWLEENGEAERAEYIRVSCDWWDGYMSVNKANRLGDRLFALLAANPRWAFPADDGFTVSVRSSFKVEAFHPEDDQTVQVETRQGFMREVRCSLAWWLTHGPDLCLRHPVREVVITDREPMPVGDDGYGVYAGYGWWRWHGDYNDDESSLPDEVFDRLEGGKHPPAGTVAAGECVMYDTRDAVQSALNAAALKWAEAEADA